MNLQLPPDRPLPHADRMADDILRGEPERPPAPARRGPWLAVAAAAVLIGVVVGVLVINRGSVGPGPAALPSTATTSAARPPATRTPSAVVTPAPSPTPVASSPSVTSPLPRTTLALGETAVFEHFEVTVTQVNAYVDRSTVRAKVCVRRLPPDPTGDTTRVSIDPWLLVAGRAEQLPARPPRQASPTDYPVEAYLRVGQCVEGALEFAASRPGSRLREVRYQNFLGDRARWAAFR